MRKKEFEELLESVKEGAEILQGKRKPSRIFSFPTPKIARLRKRLGASQTEFASMIHVSVGTLRNWEQGRRSPTGPAKALLALVAAMPKQAQKVLRSE
ncbi:MAG TPA: NadS family protein [Candidatus Kapabacteria bacterium]|nr:NadS family protein [Candidatus Kapabacteria bacterium]